MLRAKFFQPYLQEFLTAVMCSAALEEMSSESSRKLLPTSLLQKQTRDQSVCSAATKCQEKEIKREITPP